MNIIPFWIEIPVYIFLIAYLIKVYGWVTIWYGTFLVLIISLVLIFYYWLVSYSQYMILVSLLLAIFFPYKKVEQKLKKNRKLYSFYISKKTRFINWCNKYIYNIDDKQ